MFLEKINTVSDLKKLKTQELSELAHEVRQYILDVISINGGHLASSLGVVDLTLALHYVFNTPKDVLIWDVGHQTYAHKILTGRRETFKTIRRHKGISGFPKRQESPFDTYDVGHSSTSLSLALGEAVSRDLNNKKHKVVAVIGDGSLSGGMAMEALNNIGHMENDLIIILNDNEHSISKNVGALSTYLTKMITGSFYNRFRRKAIALTRRIPKIGELLYSVIYRSFSNFKGMITLGQFFEDIGIRYFGPVDGHNIPLMIDVFTRIKNINTGPKIIHVITKKGKGYTPAEMDPARFHGIGPFDKATGTSLDNSPYMTYSEIVGKTLAHLSKTDRAIIAITAAMKLGTCLYEFEQKAPKRFFDVGIAEQHAITYAGALASSGHKPFVSIYSTFLQRAADQLIHDIGIMNLPVKICIERAGIVGDDGETHHGLYDVAMIRSIPNFMFLAPSSGEELRDAVYFAAGYNEGPIAIRYPRGRTDSAVDISNPKKIIPGRIKRLTKGRDVAVFALGDMVSIAQKCSRLLSEKGIAVSVINILFIKPLDVAGIEKIINETGYFVTLENAYLAGGIGESIISSINPLIRSKQLFSAGFPDELITHGKNDELMRDHGLDPESLTSRIINEIKKRNK